MYLFNRGVGVLRRSSRLRRSLRSLSSRMNRYLDEQNDYLTEQHVAYGTYATAPLMTNSMEPRSILRKSSSNQNHQNHYNRPYAEQLPHTHSFASEMSENATTCGLIMDGAIRPAVSEFLSVFASILLFLHLDAELANRHVVAVQRFLIMALLDGISALTFYSAFRTVHLSPVISLSQSITLSTSALICGLLVLVQAVAAILAVVTHTLLRGGDVRLPTLRLQENISADDESLALYRMLFCQFLGTLLVVMSHLLSAGSLMRRNGSVRLGVYRDSQPLPLFHTIALSTFLMQLQTTLNWNPLLSLAISVYHHVWHGQSEQMSQLHLFLLSPVIAALLASLLFRTLFTSDERRLFKCGDTAGSEAANF